MTAELGFYLYIMVRILESVTFLKDLRRNRQLDMPWTE
jgi:hypothetical protein